MGIDYVICAAGAGTRMKEVNPHVAKPCLQFDNKSLLERSLESLDLHRGDQLIFIVQKKDRVSELRATIEFEYPYVDQKWVEIEGLTRGQLETAVLAQPFLRPGVPLVIFNSDTFFRSRTLSKALENEDIFGIVPCSEQPGDSWSFCRTVEKWQGYDRVDRVAEKERISNWCSVGYYFFRDPDIFLELAKKQLGRVDGEVYVAPLYNEVIERGLRVVVTDVEVFKPMGSLDQMMHYWGKTADVLKAENSRGTLVIDLDDTLTIDSSSPHYDQKLPRPEMIRKVQEYSALGYEIVIYSSRRMKTFKGDEAKVVANIAETSIAWLKQHGVPFTALRFGKPFAERGFYVDDKAIRPREFLERSPEELFNLLENDSNTK